MAMTCCNSNYIFDLKIILCSFSSVYVCIIFLIAKIKEVVIRISFFSPLVYHLPYVDSEFCRH